MKLNYGLLANTAAKREPFRTELSVAPAWLMHWPVSWCIGEGEAAQNWLIIMKLNHSHKLLRVDTKTRHSPNVEAEKK